MLQTRKYAFVIALTAAATTAVNQVPDLLIADASAGQNDVRDYVFTLNNVPASFNNQIETYLTNVECPKAVSLYGDVCDPATVPYEVKLIRQSVGNTRVVARLKLPVYVTVRPPVPPAQ